ncbi:GIY-YIG nuclease family protein [Mycolicibacterium elephantis]|uniref:GIY-YIG nuclease family protein n=1 Tax=Mycolicibacterium elephantis TaxID=81858 RepID=UPI0009EEFAA0|nr:GIY-YIG nuclease family protein [Mycolicibacterium elephantis]
MKWEQFTTLEAAAKFAPTSPGVYAIGTVSRLHGLPISTSWAYIGMAKNLRQRIAQHLPNSEFNKMLRAWIHANHAVVEIWTKKLTSADEADALETLMIGELNPIFNTMKRTNLGKKDDNEQS